MTNYNNKRKAAREALTRQQVCDAVEKMLKRTDPDKLTVAMVAREAGIAPGTLYHYFKNKADLLAYIILKACESVEKEADASAASDMSATEKLRDYIRRNLEFNDSKKKIFHLLFKESSLLSMEPTKEINEARARADRRLLRIIEDGVRRKEFRNISPLNLALAFSGIFQSYSGHRIMHNPFAPIENAVKDIMDIFMKGAER